MFETRFLKNDEAEKNWWIIDAKDQTLGRLATQIAGLLRGKDKPQFTPHTDSGDFVVVVNAEKVKMSGTKWTDKKYFRHSRFFGSLKAKTAAEVLDDKPEDLLRAAVKGMLPVNRMSFHVINKLKVFKGTDHPHDAQKPQIYQLKK